MDSKKPYAPLGKTNTARSAAKGQHRFGWYMVSAGVLLSLALVFWLNRLERETPAGLKEDDRKKEVSLEPDGPEKPGMALGVPFGDETCVPWHVSAASALPAMESRFIIVTSRLVDPYGYTATGFGKECEGRASKILVAEDIKEGQLEKLVSSIKPAAVLAVGEASAELVRKLAPDTPLLYAMVMAPGRSDLDHAGFAGVIPEVPVGVAVRRMVKTLPRNAKNIAVVHGSGVFSSLTKDALNELKSLRRNGIVIGLGPKSIERKLVEVIENQDALIVLVDGEVLDDKLLEHIMVVAEERKIPVCVSDERHVMMGAYVGIGVDSYRIGRQLCHLAGAVVRGDLPKGSSVFCPEYSFAVLNNAVIEKLAYMLDPEQFVQVKLYKWN